MNVNPYLVFNGKCREAFEFYANVLGGELSVMTHAEAPGGEETPPGQKEMVMHAQLEAGGAILMGSDGMPGQPETPGGFSISLVLDDPAEADRIFAALSEGARVDMPIQETFWAIRFGQLTDRFGMPWMVNIFRPM